MYVIEESVYSLPVLIPIEHLDGIVVGAGEHIWLDRVDNDMSDVVSVFFECFDLFGSVVIKHV